MCDTIIHTYPLHMTMQCLAKVNANEETNYANSDGMA